ncbi:hypothetical protein ABXZ88_003906 [Vibrio fluvialis]|uniref:hypothetical protein n=1 Tax=Vibrio fluvialis TaxID=676 RepID=UPI0023A91EAD|nr:hypothetical protein [Vibrio fluvialis]MDE5179048.1 hypothetical protein [Vibrio fluvialis]
MPSELHEAQNLHAIRWMKKQGFSVVASNIRAAQSREIIDAIGFRDLCSILIESKVSRSDFLADRKKPERQKGAKGLGTYRFYICPVGLIDPQEVLPLGWGLLYSDGKKVVEEFKPKGNHWPMANDDFALFSEWIPFQHEVNERAERSMLFSLCRRLVSNQPIIK